MVLLYKTIRCIVEQYLLVSNKVRGSYIGQQLERLQFLPSYSCVWSHKPHCSGHHETSPQFSDLDNKFKRTHHMVTSSSSSHGVHIRVWVWWTKSAKKKYSKKSSKKLLFWRLFSSTLSTRACLTARLTARTARLTARTARLTARTAHLTARTARLTTRTAEPVTAGSGRVN